MRKWYRVLPALLVVAVLGGLVWLLFRSREPEPLYQGKPLTYWLQGFSRYPPPKKGEVRPTDSEAQAAIKQLGTNARSAVPALLKLLVKEETNAAAHPSPPVGPGTFTGTRFNTVWGLHPPTGKSPGPAAFGSGTADVITPVTAALKAIDPEAAARAGLQ